MAELYRQHGLDEAEWGDATETIAAAEERLRQVTGKGQDSVAAVRRRVESERPSAPKLDDTGRNVPESQRTLELQQQALVEGRQAVQMFPVGTAPLALPPGMEAVTTPRGTFHFNPRLVTAAEIRAKSAAGRENELLGLGPASKADVVASGEPVMAATERAPDGTEVKAALVTPSTAPATLAELEARKAPGHRVGVEPVGQPLVEREAAAELEKAKARTAEVVSRKPPAGGVVREPGAGYGAAPSLVPVQVGARQLLAEVGTTSPAEEAGNLQAVVAQIERISAGGEVPAEFEAFTKYSTVLKPVARTTAQYARSIGADDPRLFASEAHLIDHHFHHHPQNTPADYARLPDVMQSPDHIRRTKTGSFIFTKRFDRWHGVMVTVEVTPQGKIVYARSVFVQDTEPFKNRPDVMTEATEEGARSSIGYSASRAPPAEGDLSASSAAGKRIARPVPEVKPAPEATAPTAEPSPGETVREDTTAYEPGGEDEPTMPRGQAEQQIEQELRRGREAVETALRKQTDVPAAFTRPELGPVSLIWGERGEYDATTDRIRGGHGLARTIQLAELAGLDGAEVVRQIPEIVLRGDMGPFYGPPDGPRVNATWNGQVAVLSLHRFGDRQTWVVEAWRKEERPASAATVNAATDYAPPATGMSPTEGAGKANVARVLPEVKALHELAARIGPAGLRQVTKVTPPNPAARGSGDTAPVMVNGKPVTAADVRGTFPEPTTIKHGIETWAIAQQQQIDLSSGNETVIYRGETEPPRAVRVIPTGLMDGSELSPSVYPYVRVELDNGSAFYLQVRISNHPNYYVPYSVDIHSFLWDSAAPGLIRAVQNPATALAPENWPDVEQEILRQLNEPGRRMAFEGDVEGGYVAQVWNRQRDLITKGADQANEGRAEYEPHVNAWRVHGVVHDPTNPRRRVVIRSRDALQRKRGLDRYEAVLVTETGVKAVRRTQRRVYRGNDYEALKKATLAAVNATFSPVFASAEKRGLLFEEPGEYRPAKPALEREIEQATMPRAAATLAEARAVALREIVGRTLTNIGTGMTATMSNRALEKMTSASAVGKSSSPATHALAVANADQLFAQADWIESRPDRQADPNVKAIHVFAAPMIADGDVVAVKLTVKEFAQPAHGTRLYSLAAVDVETAKPAGLLALATSGLPQPTNAPLAGFSEKLRRLAQAVKAAKDSGNAALPQQDTVFDAPPTPAAPDWRADFPMLEIHTNGKTLQADPDYRAAKAGDADAALRLVSRLAKRDRLRAVAQAHPNAIIVPVRAIESAGDNKLPWALAVDLHAASARGMPFDTDIVQVNEVGHTGADAFSRLVAVPQFDGPVLPGRDYILVDDFVTSGSTVNALRMYIEARGGRVVRVLALATTSSPLMGYGGVLAPTASTLDALRVKYDTAALEALLNEIGLAQKIGQLTNSQASYLLCAFPSFDRLRDRITAARGQGALPEIQRADGGVSAPVTSVSGQQIADFVQAQGITDPVKRKEAEDGIARAVQRIESLRKTARDDAQGQLRLFGDPDQVPAPPAAPKQAAPKPALDIEREAAALRGSAPELISALREKGHVSAIVPGLIAREIPVWNIQGAKIESPADLAATLWAVSSPYFESAKVAVLDSEGTVVRSGIVSVGSLNQAIVETSQVLGFLEEVRRQHGKNYTRVIVAHNHPSGDPAPSSEDVAVTRRLASAAKSLGFDLVDHVITNGGRYVSLLEVGLHSTGSGPAGQKAPASVLAEAGPVATHPAGKKLPWEVVSRADLPPITSPADVDAIARHLRNDDPDAGHVFYLSTKNRLIGVERLVNVAAMDQGALQRQIHAGALREGAAAAILDLTGIKDFAKLRQTASALKKWGELTGLLIHDVVAQSDTEAKGFMSLRQSGVWESPADYGATAAGDTAADRQPASVGKPAGEVLREDAGPYAAGPFALEERDGRLWITRCGQPYKPGETIYSGPNTEKHRVRLERMAASLPGRGGGC